MTTARVLVVDDDVRIAASVRRSLSYEGHEVFVAHDGPDGLEAARSLGPDVIVLDIMLPGFDGIEVLRRLRAEGNRVAVLMLTARTEVPDRVEGLGAGADDYLTKPFAHEELVARVAALLRRIQHDERDLLLCGPLSIDVGAMEVHIDGKAVDLTTQEFHLLEYLARNQRLVLSRISILEEVWGLDTDTTSNIVDQYIRYLRQKLETGGRPRLIHTVRGAGYVLKEG